MLKTLLIKTDHYLNAEDATVKDIQAAECSAVTVGDRGYSYNTNTCYG
jgi:hypothetical protein